MPYFNAYTRVKSFLKDLMKSIMERIQKHPNEPVPTLFKEMSMGSIAKDLQRQINAYWREEYPFKQSSPCNNPIVRWQELEKLSDARVLAVCMVKHNFFVDWLGLQFLAIRLFSVLVNSMSDERTASKFTWLNAPLRGRQDVQNIVDMVQIGQWYAKNVVCFFFSCSLYCL